MGKHKKKTHTETQHKYNLNFRCPKYLPQMFFFFFLFGFSFVILPCCQFDEARLLCGISIEIHRQKQNIRNKISNIGFLCDLICIFGQTKGEIREGKQQNEQKQIKN